ncbi:MAG: hypothetical protein Q9224_005453, partial [Gallowayella concinna]
YPLIVNALSEQAFDEKSVAVAREYRIISNDTTDIASTTKAIQQCLTDYTNSLPKSSAVQQDKVNSSKLCHDSKRDLCYDHTDICQSVYAPVIDDIAGVGVSVFGTTANGIALVAFALLRLFDFWIYYLTIVLLGCVYGLKEAQAKADWARQSGLRQRVPHLIAALFEFQKAQCFFMIAVQTAAIITVKRGGFDAKTLQQLSNSYSAITLVAICGYFPVVFTLLNLHGANQDSWYVIGLTTITVVISGVTAFTTKQFKPSQHDLIGLHNVTGSWASCGNRNPTTFCFSSDTVDPFGYGGGAKHIFVFCIVVLALLIVDKFRISQGHVLSKTQTQIQIDRNPRRIHTSLLKQRALTGLSALSRVPTYCSNLDVKTKKTINVLIYGCIWILFLFFYCRWIYLLSKWINNESGVIGPSTWTFGQIVGITVWVPSLIQYAYLETRVVMLTAVQVVWWLGSSNMLQEKITLSAITLLQIHETACNLQLLLSDLRYGSDKFFETDSLHQGLVAKDSNIEILEDLSDN